MKTVCLIGLLIFMYASSAGALPLLTLSLPERAEPRPSLALPMPQSFEGANVLALEAGPRPDEDPGWALRLSRLGRD